MKKYELENLGIINFKFVDIQENNDDGSLTVYGWASKTNIDTANEIVPLEAIDYAIEDYAKFANIREMHNPFLGGAGVAEVLVSENEGLWLQAKLYDTEVIKKVKNKVYKGFSIGYITHSSYVRGDGVKVLAEIELVEISVVDRPMNVECLMEHAEKFIEIKTNNLGGKMSKVLTLEKKANMSDECFGFVGMLDGKYSRILPYKDETGQVDSELAVASLNVLNSNRPEDVKFLTDEEKAEIYKTITESLKNVEFKGVVPELKLNNKEFGNKTVTTKSVSFEEVQKEVEGFINSKKSEFFGEVEEAKGVLAEFKALLKETFTLNKKAIEIQSNPTNFDSTEKISELKSKIWSVPWTLERVLDNILHEDDLTSEEKKIKAIQAFNDAKNAWTSIFDEIVLISETGNKSVKTNKEQKMERKSIIVDGVKYVPVAEDGNNPESTEATNSKEEKAVKPKDSKTVETPAEETNEKPAESEESVPEGDEKPEETTDEKPAETEEESKSVKGDFVTKSDFEELSKKFDDLVEQLGGYVKPSSQKFAKPKEEKFANEEDEDFWN